MTSSDPFDLNRRRLICALGATAGATLMPGFSLAAEPKKPHKVVIVGGGFAGATAAKYLRMWSNSGVDVTLIERSNEYISCPTSNEVLSGTRSYKTLIQGYENLKRHWGVNVINEEVISIDTANKVVQTDKGAYVYERLIVAPGIEFMFDAIEGYDAAAQKTVLHAWKAGPQTVALRRQLEMMKNGGTYVLSIPKAPYRCPPGPYERACQIAWYFKKKKPKSRVVILDANDSIQSKAKIFQTAFNTWYAGMIDYRPNWTVVEVNANSGDVVSDLGEIVKGDVLNVIPPMRAAEIARKMGLANLNDRWAEVDWVTMESRVVPHVHVLGDAVFSAPQMPKSAHMANQHGKAVAAALVEIFAGHTPKPMLMANTCYSMLNDREAVHVASVHRYNPSIQAPQIVIGSGGVSAEPSVAEGRYAHGWALAIWADTFA